MMPMAGQKAPPGVPILRRETPRTGQPGFAEAEHLRAALAPPTAPLGLDPAPHEVRPAATLDPALASTLAAGARAMTIAGVADQVSRGALAGRIADAATRFDDEQRQGRDNGEAK